MVSLTIVIVPVAVSLANTFCPLPLACRARLAAFSKTGVVDVPMDPAVLNRSILVAMPLVVPVIPVPAVTILPAPAVAAVALKKKAPAVPTVELEIVMGVVVELNESEKKAEPLALAVRFAVLIA